MHKSLIILIIVGGTLSGVCLGVGLFGCLAVSVDWQGGAI